MTRSKRPPTGAKSDIPSRFDAIIAAGGVVLFGADTVYGLACDPQNPRAVERLYALKRRPPEQASAVMYFDLGVALAAHGDLGPRCARALRVLLPGGVTLVLPGERGLRVVDVPVLRGARSAVLQSSANLHGEPPARRLADVHPEIRAAVDLAVDAGELPGTASTVVDLRIYEATGAYEVLREGTLSREDLSAALVP